LLRRQTQSFDLSFDDENWLNRFNLTS
jgi:hypothetical protein